MKKLRFYIGIILVMGFVLVGKAQVTVQFAPTVLGQSIEGLGLAQLLSSYPDMKDATVTITVDHIRFGRVLRIQTPSFVIKPGMNPINRSAYSGSSTQFGSNVLAQQLKSTGRLGEGEYEICYTVNAGSKATITESFEQCFSAFIQPITPLLLTNPMDGDVNCNTRPNFIWQAPMPFSRDMRFGIQVVELKDRQSKEEAIVNNLPLISQFNIPVGMLVFPPTIRELSKEKNYVWQVTVYSGKTILSKSEIWEFKVSCVEESLPPGAGETFRELREGENAIIHPVNRFLRFSFNNPYSAGSLQYSVHSLTDPETPAKNLPAIKLSPGLNKCEIDLYDLKYFKEGEEYLLTVRLAADRVLKLRFIYHNPR